MLAARAGGGSSERFIRDSDIQRKRITTLKNSREVSSLAEHEGARVAERWRIGGGGVYAEF